MDNAKTLLSFRELFRTESNRNHSSVDSVTIISSSSPEGRTTYNHTLSHIRANAVKDYLLQEYPDLKANRIIIIPQGENWEAFRELVARDANIPDKDEVLQIMDVVTDTEQRKLLLRRLNRGMAYRYLEEHIFPLLRNAAVCRVRMKKPIPPIQHDALSSGQSVTSHIYNVDRTDCEKQGSSFRIPQMTSIANTAGNSADTPVSNNTRPLFAVKTNLLFDLAAMPNIELEFPVGNRWSVNGEWMFPWWLFSHDKYCMQLISGTLEGRYWLGSRSHRENRRILTGHFLGFYAGGGKYDLQWIENGYQGEFYIASGLSYGYCTPIGKNLNLEFSFGIGLLRTNYKHYHAKDNYQTLLWQENGKYTWFGPTKAKISLVWLLGRQSKKGGRR